MGSGWICVCWTRGIVVLPISRQDRTAPALLLEWVTY
jgi:hypothetical protein